MTARAQTLPDTARLDAWIRFLRAHSALTRELSAELVAQHGLTLNDYEVLLHVARAPEKRMRRVDLAQSVLLTASGITRLLEGLEHAGLVVREACDDDRRVVWAKLTPAGADRLRQAARTHVAGVESLFIGRFSDEERATLSSLLARLPGADRADGGDCEPRD
jgi:DNA-binding MarR family transcriptional regulator